MSETQSSFFFFLKSYSHAVFMTGIRKMTGIENSLHKWVLCCTPSRFFCTHHVWESTRATFQRNEKAIHISHKSHIKGAKTWRWVNAFAQNQRNLAARVNTRMLPMQKIVTRNSILTRSCCFVVTLKQITFHSSFKKHKTSFNELKLFLFCFQFIASVPKTKLKHEMLQQCQRKHAFEDKQTLNPLWLENWLKMFPQELSFSLSFWAWIVESFAWHSLTSIFTKLALHLENDSQKHSSKHSAVSSAKTFQTSADTNVVTNKQDKGDSLLLSLGSTSKCSQHFVSFSAKCLSQSFYYFEMARPYVSRPLWCRGSQNEFLHKWSREQLFYEIRTQWTKGAFDGGVRRSKIQNRKEWKKNFFPSSKKLV